MGRTGRKKKPSKHLFSSIAQVAIAHTKHQYHINLKYQREYLGGRETYVIKSFLSFSFFNPPKAILVPGMYFFGFSRYSN